MKRLSDPTSKAGYISSSTLMLAIKVDRCIILTTIQPKWFYSVVVITFGSDPNNPGSNPGRTFFMRTSNPMGVYEEVSIFYLLFNRRNVCPLLMMRR